MDGKFTRGLTVEDLLKIISTDVNKSFVQIDGVSDAIIGNLTYTGRMNRELTRVITSNGRFKFLNSKFPFLVSTECYWTSSVYGYEKLLLYKKMMILLDYLVIINLIFVKLFQ